MIQEPTNKRAFVFVDGQNLFYAAKQSFGYSFPNYDVRLLAERVCSNMGWSSEQIYFYTGVPTANDNQFWHAFWDHKLAAMGQQRIKIFTRPLKYRNQRIVLPDGTTTTVLVGNEKGIDVRIALDIIRLAREEAYDVALVFSQDQDLSEVADNIRQIAKEQNRWIKIASAFPVSPTTINPRGINHTDWIRIDRNLYNSCTDPKDYR